MGKSTGFLEFERVPEPRAPVAERVRHYREFVPALPAPDARRQASRCMDCGTPFCAGACPVSNVIPDFNDLVVRDDWRRALATLHATNNFPEFTGRVCPAPCEAGCTLNFNDVPVGIKSIEQAIVDRGWAEGWIVPEPAAVKTGRSVAIVGSGPAGLAAAQELARRGHDVTVFEKSDRPGGLLRYGIPDFKLEKHQVDRRIEQLVAEGVTFRTRVCIGSRPAVPVADDATELLAADDLYASFDAVLLAIGAEQPRDLAVPGRDLPGVHLAMDYLGRQNRRVAGDDVPGDWSAEGRHVVVLGGGDTGSDCVGTANRQGAASVTQFELLPRPPEREDKARTWPYWPVKLRTSSSHEEGCGREFALATEAFLPGPDGRVAAVRTARLDAGRRVDGSERDWPADLVLLAMGFLRPVGAVLDAFGVETDARGNARATQHRTSRPRVYAAGDARRGQSLVVWALREGRDAARTIHHDLTSRTP